MKTTASVALLAAILTLSCQTERRAQLEHAANMTPRSYASLGGATPEAVDITTLTVRVWVDPAYVEATDAWYERVENQFARANEIAEVEAHLRLHVVSVQQWTPRGSEMTALLPEIAAHDPGEGVDLVIAMTGSESGWTASQHRLGYAGVLEKHAVLRAMNDSSEWIRIEDELDKLEYDERRAVYRERLRHKEAVVLLHEVGHMLGALHTRADGYVMSTHYSVGEGRLADANRKILAGTLALDRSGSHTLWRKEALEVVENVSQGEGKDALDAAVVETLRQNRGLGPAEYEVLNRASALTNQGKHEEAHAALGQLDPGLTEHPQVIVAACAVWLNAKPEDPRSHALCLRAAELQPDSFHAHYSLAGSFREREEWKEAADAALEAQQVLEKDGQSAAKDWLALAGLYASLSMPTRAEQATSRIPMLTGVARVREWVTRERQYWCVPAQSVDELEEGAAIRAVQDAWQAMESGDPSKLQALAKRFPTLPAVDALSCGHQMMSGDRDGGAKRCHTALESGPCFSAHNFLGRHHFADGKLDSARKHLESAAAIHDENPATQDLLRQVYERQGDRDALKRLEKQPPRSQ